MTERIALLGAESTGKTRLAQELADHLRRAGRQVIVIDEVLRHWCEREQRTPRADEQAGIAREQARRALEAEADVVIADTTPLMTAVYSDMLFDDTTLYDFALAHQRSYTATLLTGLDLPWVADGLQRDGPHVRVPVDAKVRAALEGAGLPFHVVYGQGPQRLTNALQTLGWVPPEGAVALTEGRRGAWQWVCDKCSDPACEHRLFQLRATTS
jgi:nicotinamide riboside kinase